MKQLVIDSHKSMRPTVARWPGLQDDSRIRYPEIMYAKFWRNTDVGQINSIQLEHGCRRLWEQYRSREEICWERKGLFFLGAKQGHFQRSRKATVRHDTDKGQSKDKSLPLSARLTSNIYSSTDNWRNIAVALLIFEAGLPEAS